MNRIERYLGQVVVTHTLLVLFVVLVVQAFFEFISQLSKASDKYTLIDITIYTLLKLPVHAYEVFSVALLIGVLMGLGRLANQSELTVIRVSGWSVQRILFAVLKTVVILWAMMAVLGEVVAPASEAYAKKFRGEILHKDISIGSKNGLWLKEADSYTFVERIVSPEELQNITVYLKQGDELVGQINAEKARYVDGKWVLFNVHQQNFLMTPLSQGLPASFVESKLSLIDWKAETLEQLKLDFPLEPKVIESLNIDSHYMSIIDLYGYMGFLHENELESSNYELAFYRKLASPLVILGMVAIVFPLIFGLQRQANTGQRIFVGILIGIAFHLFNQMFGNVSIIYGFPALVGAFLPAVVLLMFSYYFVRKL